MLKKILMAASFLAVITGCQQGDEIPNDSLIVAEITESELPQTASAFILENYEGEVITSAFRISSDGEVTYEANLTNRMNLVFSSNGRLSAFGEDGSEVDCSGKHRKRGSFGKPPGGFDENRPKPNVLDLKDLPADAAAYLSGTYPDKEILKIIYIERGELNQFHVLVKEVGIVIFDGVGAFVELREKPLRNCANFQPIDVANLPLSISSYVTANYPDDKVLKARKGTRNEKLEFHVLVKEVGVLIFDGDGKFVELKTCGMNKG